MTRPLLSQHQLCLQPAIVSNILIYIALTLIYPNSYGYTLNTDSDALSWMFNYTSRQASLSPPWHTIRMFLQLALMLETRSC